MISAPVKSYWAASRAPRYSVLFALPLFVLYEALAAGLGGTPGIAHVRNAADVALKTPFMLLSGARGSLAFFATVIAASVFFVGRDLVRTKEKLDLRLFGLMLGESALLAALLGLVVGMLTQQILGGLSGVVAQSTDIGSLNVATKFMLALGAGLYEELLFRVLLVGGLAAGLRWLLVGKPVLTGIIAAVIGALIFSAFHYIGDFGEPFEVGSFTYRAIAGLVFSGLYLTRGFGITAWTHALYDVYVMVL